MNLAPLPHHGWCYNSHVHMRTLRQRKVQLIAQVHTKHQWQN